MDQSANSHDQSKPAPNINIDINGADQDEANIKNGLNVDAGVSESRVGLSKDELMKYANQPFWVRIRNTLFASFWIVWISILVVAIGFVVNSPGCKMVSAHSPLVNSTVSAVVDPSSTTAP